MKVSAIAAIGRRRELGKDNRLLWHLPQDLKRFREITTGHPVVMGRKTFDSIFAMIGKPLPGRTNIVITRDEAWAHEGAVRASSIEEALAAGRRAPGGGEVFIIGGASIYEQALPLTDTLYLTLIDEAEDADAFFPPYESDFTRVLLDEPHQEGGISYRFVTLERQ